MLCLFPFFTRLIATICDWSTGSTEIKRKCRIVPNEPQTEGTVEQNLKNCRHSCIYVKMQNANVWRIHKWQLDIGTHAIGKSGSLNRIRIFFFYLLDTHLFCFIHSSFPPSLFVFYLKQILFRIFLFVLYPSSNVYLCFEWSLFSWRVVHVFEWETPFFLWNSPFFVGLIHRHTSPGNSSVYDYQVYLDLYKTAFLKKNFFFFKWFHQLTHCFRCAAANSAAKDGKNNHFVERTCFFRRVEIDG